jgi:hypothetical protein
MRLARYVAVALAGLMLAPASAIMPAGAQQRCTLARLSPMGMLEHCDDQLRSRVLEMEDLRRILTVEQSGVFYFACPLEDLCGDDPQISGWIVNGRRWQPSPQDEQTIFGIFQAIPAPRGFSRNNPLSIAQPESLCGLFDVTLAGLSGRGVCYRSDDQQASAVVVVVSDATLGFILVFHQQDIDGSVLKEKVLALLPRFKLQVATGDIGIARWLR